MLRTKCFKRDLYWELRDISRL